MKGLPILLKTEGSPGSEGKKQLKNKTANLNLRLRRKSKRRLNQFKKKYYFLCFSYSSSLDLTDNILRNSLEILCGNGSDPLYEEYSDIKHKVQNDG